jgi:hypothetical protein
MAVFHKKIIFFLFLSIFLFSGKIVLADTIGLSIDQSIFSFDLAPGEQKTFSFNAKNISDSNEQIAANFQDFNFGDNSEIANLTPKNELNGVSEWLSVNEKDLKLNSQESQALTMTISVPKDAAVGSHWALVSLQAIPEITGQNFQTTIVTGQVGIYVLVNVTGKISGSGNLESFEAPLLTDKQAILKAAFENTGNIHYIPHGEVQIKNLITRQTQNIEVEKHFVFPGKKYLFELAWDKASLFGAYYAQAFFVDGNGNVHASGRLFFGKFFFAIVIILIIILVFIYIFRKRILEFSPFSKGRCPTGQRDLKNNE